MKTISFLVAAIGIIALVAVIAPLALVNSQQQYAFAANDLDKVIKAANEGKDDKFGKTCVKAGGILTETACDLSQNP